MLKYSIIIIINEKHQSMWAHSYRKQTDETKKQKSYINDFVQSTKRAKAQQKKQTNIKIDIDQIEFVLNSMHIMLVFSL